MYEFETGEDGIARHPKVQRDIDAEAALDVSPAVECDGHPASEFDPMGETSYCDGSCK